MTKDGTPIITLDLLQKWEIEQLNLPEGRRYQMGNMKFPSVSTILSAIADNTELNLWKARVGFQQASFVSKQATNYGTFFHNALEKFLIEGKEPVVAPLRSETREIIELFKKGSRILAVEYPLISSTLEVAGTVDCIAEFQGVPVIIDFKTYRKQLYPNTLQKYKIQAFFYAMMANEMYKLNIRNVIILAKKPHTPLVRIHHALDETLVYDALKKYKEMH